MSDQLSSKSKMKIAGWIVSVIASFPLIGSGFSKIILNPDALEKLTHVGYQASSVARGIGFLELSIPTLFLINKTSRLGAILSTGFMGATVCLHLRLGEPFIFQLTVGALFWLGYGLRKKNIFYVFSEN